MTCRPARRAFTLIEAMVALALLGGGLVTVMAMFAPLARTGASDGELLAAADAARAVNARLRERGFEEARLALGQTFLVDREAVIVGTAADPVWDGRAGEQYFAVAPVLHGGLIGSGNSADLPWLAFSLRVRWPASAGDGATRREMEMMGSVHR